MVLLSRGSNSSIIGHDDTDPFLVQCEGKTIIIYLFITCFKTERSFAACRQSIIHEQLHTVYLDTGEIWSWSRCDVVTQK